MNLIDKLIGLGLGDDLTETAWWTETVFRELSRQDPDAPGSADDAAVALGAATPESI